MSKLLIVDDEVRIREVIKEYAHLNGHSVKEAHDGLEALEIFEREDFDVVVLDIMMPNLDGYSTCKKMKALKNVPIIILSARQEEYDKLYAYDLGIDYYLTKPFSPKELMAIIKVVTERGNVSKSSIQIEGIKIDESGMKLYVDDAEVHITPKEFELLMYFIKNRNMVLSREKLLAAVWNYDYYGDDRTVDTHIKMLRRNLGPYRDYIKTVRGIGYKFEVQ